MNNLGKQIRIFIAIFLTLFIAKQCSGQLLDDDVYKFAKAFNVIDKFYVDTVNREKLAETAIIKMLEELDPHSVYISKKELKKMREPLKGSFDGIGIQFNILKDTLMVVATITGGPSEKVGLMAGDKIIEVDGETIAGTGLKNSDVFKLLRGKRGTKVEVGIQREGNDELLDFMITRDKIPINSLDAAYMIDDKTVYVKLNRFSATSMKEYYTAMSNFHRQGARNIILDLTNNGGGYLRTAIDLADEFLKNNDVVVYTEGLNVEREDYKATSRGLFEDGKVVVMIDEGSASASEIVSGAIQDWDRGVIVGRRSFGKGLVQKPFNLPDGSVIRLTVARYHTPTGRVIQKPYDKGIKQYHKDLIDRYEDGELMHEDSIDFPDSLKYETLRYNRTVYGGGGIMPDIFVSIDTSYYTDFYRDLIRRGIFNEFILTYVNKNRESIKSSYSSFEDFKKNYKVSKKFFDDLLAFAKEKKVTPNEGDLERSNHAIHLQIKALIARNIYGINEFFESINKLDPIFNKAVEVITQKKTYKSHTEKP